MARIAEWTSARKATVIALTYIFGVGPTIAQQSAPRPASTSRRA